ncbi:MAG: MFS transporter [Desulfobacterales bacterium]|nr:MFS transporter [Deltaproteobacteria bacterium]NNK95645.1 MFS transporter [Desulfobacterales bacterium]
MTSTSNNQPDSLLKDTPDEVPSHQQPYRWLILALLWLLYFSFGVVTRSASPLVTPIIRDLEMSYGQMGFVLGSWQMTYIVLAITAGVIMDRWGIRRAIFFGALVIGLSSVLRSASSGFFSLLFFVALFGVGGPMISIGCPKTIATWFTGKERGTAVGIYTTGPWIGGMASLALTNSVVMPLTNYSWRMTFVCYGVMTFVFAGLWWGFTREADTGAPTERFNVLAMLADLFKVRSVRLILLSGLLAFGIMHGYFAWLPKILENTGMSPAKAGIASALPFLTSIPSVLIFPRFVQPHYRGWLIGLMALLAGLSIIWVVIMQWPAVPGLLLFGLSGPCLMPLLVLSLMETPEVASKYLGSATGVFFCVAEVGGFLGPFVVGYLVDVFGTFASGGLFLCGLGVAIFGLMFLLQTTSN